MKSLVRRLFPCRLPSKPLAYLSRTSREQAANLPMRDFAHFEGKDSEVNRNRRALFYGALPRTHVPDPKPSMSRFAFGVLFILTTMLLLAVSW